MTALAVIENASGAGSAAGQLNSFASRPRSAPQDGSSFRSGLVSLLAVPGNAQLPGIAQRLAGTVPILTNRSDAPSASPDDALEGAFHDAEVIGGGPSRGFLFARPQPAATISQTSQSPTSPAAAAKSTGGGSPRVVNLAVFPQIPSNLSHAGQPLPAQASSARHGNTSTNASAVSPESASPEKKITGNAEQAPGIAAFLAAAAPVLLSIPQPALNAGPQAAPLSMRFAAQEQASDRVASSAFPLPLAVDVPQSSSGAQPSARESATDANHQAASNVEEGRNLQSASVQDISHARGAESFGVNPSWAGQHAVDGVRARPSGDPADTGSAAISDSLSTQIQIVSPTAPGLDAPARLAEPADASNAIHGSGKGSLLNAAASAASSNPQPQQASPRFDNASQPTAPGYQSEAGSKVLPVLAQRPELRSRPNDAARPAPETLHPGQQPGAALQAVSIPAISGRGGTLAFGSPSTQSQPSGLTAAGAPSRDTFAAMDAEASGATPTWIHAGAGRAEAGFQDPTLGWVGVRASLNGGSVHASLIPGSDDAAAMLGSHLAGLNEYLAQHHAEVSTLSLAPPESRSIIGESGQGADQPPQQGAGQSSQQDSQQGSQGGLQEGSHENLGQSPNELFTQAARHDIGSGQQASDSSTNHSSAVNSSAIAMLVPMAGRAGGTYISVMV